MSEEIMQNEATQAESMADYEAHFDDANPWNVVKGYMDNKTRLHINIEGIVNGGDSSLLPECPSLTLRIWKIIF